MSPLHRRDASVRFSRSSSRARRLQSLAAMLAMVMSTDCAVAGGRGFAREKAELSVPHVATPMELVQKMLELAKVGSQDTVYDLGSGDGRIVIMAAQKFGAQAVGIEINPDRYGLSVKRIRELGLEPRAKILHEDIFDTSLVSYRRATVVTIYLLPRVNQRLRPILERQLRPGTRIVSHDYEVPEWKAEKVDEVKSNNGTEHKLYLYIRP